MQCIQTYLPKFQQQATEQGITLDTEAIVNAADLAIQAPLAANDFVVRLKQCQQQGKAGSEAVLCARVESFVNPGSGKLNTTFDGRADLQRDQARRMSEITQALQSQGQQ